MPTRLHSARELAAYAAASPTIPKDPDRAEVRLYACVLTATVFWSLLTTAMHIAGIEASVVYAVATLNGLSLVMAVLFSLAACLTLPHLISLTFLPYSLHKRMPRKMAALGTALAAVLWAAMGNLARPLDLGPVPFIYWASAIGYVIVSVTYGYSLNVQMAKGN